MNDPDRLLARIWAADEAPPRDPGFVIAVMERAGRQRFWTGVAGLVPAAIAVGAILWAAAPMIRAGARAALDGPMVGATVAALTMAAWLWFLVTDRSAPIHAFG